MAGSLSVIADQQPMANLPLLIVQIADHEEPSSPASTTTIDEAVESVLGSPRFLHLLGAVLATFACAFDACQSFINVFTDYTPSWHCLDGGHNSSCSSVSSSPCGLPVGSWSWDRPIHHVSVVSDWNLQCSPDVLLSMPASAFFAGCVVGGLLFATAADYWLGRKRTLVFSCLLMSISGALTALSPNIWVYAALRFTRGLSQPAIATNALVLSTELVCNRWRDRMSVITFFTFTAGFASLSGIAYGCRDSSWRFIYLWTSIPCFCYAILVYCFLNESPRWLYVCGRREEAIRTLKSMSSSNDSAIDLIFSNMPVVEVMEKASIFSALNILFTERWVARRMGALIIAGLGVGIVYYGMPLNVGNLGSNIYLGVALDAVVELPASLFTLFLVGRVSRKLSVLTLTLVSGIASVLCIFLINHGNLQMAAEVLSFFSCCSALNMLLIYSIELFPTCIRNSAMTVAGQAPVIGGFLAPPLVAVGRKRRAVSFGVFGLVIFLGGLFVIFLPETKGRGICDTMEEEEHRQGNNFAAGVNP